MPGGAARLSSPAIYLDYAASKAAIDNFTIGLAREVAEEGMGTADEIAQAVAFLLSDAASYVTGATLDVSGGR